MLDQFKRNNNSIINSLRLLKVKRIISFVFLSAGVLFALMLSQTNSKMAAGVTLSATAASRTVNAGQSAVYTININRDGYTDKVTLSVSNLPSGAVASFSPNPTTGKSSVLTVTTKTTTPAGTYKLKIGGSAAGITIAPISVTLIVNPASNVTLSVLPDFISIIAGQSVTAEVYMARTNYDGPVTLEAANLPEGISVTFDENPSYGKKTNMRIYSHRYPHIWKDHDITIKASYRDGLVTDIKVRFVINCGIEWVKQFGTVNEEINVSGTGDTYQSVAVDNSGNIYVVGDTHVPGQGTEVWVTKYNNAGQQQWFSLFGTPGEFDDRVLDVAVDGAGNVFLGGYTNGTFPNNGNSGGFDFWIAKYNSAGNQLWIRQGGGSVEDGGNGFEIVPDGTGGGKFTTFQNDRRNVVTHAFDSNGFLSTSNSFQIPLLFRHQPWDIALGPNNTVVIVGAYTNGPVKIAYLLKYDNQNGSLLQQETFSVEDTTIARRAVVDNNGKVYVAGTSQDLNGPDLSVNAWVRIYDTNNQIVEKRIKSSNEDDFINALTIDQNGDLIVAGKTKGVIGNSNGGGDDAWVARLHNITADIIWLRQFPVAEDDSFETAAIDGGAIILAGHTRSFVSQSSSRDALLMRYSATITPTRFQFPPVINSITDPSTGQIISNAAVGTTVRINGTGFLNPLSLYNNTVVRFNGVPAMTTSISMTAIDAIVPAGASTTNGYVTVTKDCECVQSPMQFMVP